MKSVQRHRANYLKCVFDHSCKPCIVKKLFNCFLSFHLGWSFLGLAVRATQAHTGAVEADEESGHNHESRGLEQQIKTLRHISKHQVPKCSILCLHVSDGLLQSWITAQ